MWVSCTTIYIYCQSVYTYHIYYSSWQCLLLIHAVWKGRLEDRIRKIVNTALTSCVLGEHAFGAMSTWSLNCLAFFTHPLHIHGEALPTWKSYLGEPFFGSLATTDQRSSLPQIAPTQKKKKHCCSLCVSRIPPKCQTYKPSPGAAWAQPTTVVVPHYLVTARWRYGARGTWKIPLLMAKRVRRKLKVGQITVIFFFEIQEKHWRKNKYPPWN